MQQTQEGSLKIGVRRAHTVRTPHRPLLGSPLTSLFPRCWLAPPFRSYTEACV